MIREFLRRLLHSDIEKKFEKRKMQLSRISSGKIEFLKHQIIEEV